MGEKEAFTSYFSRVLLILMEVDSLSIEFLCAKPLILTGALLTSALGRISDLLKHNEMIILYGLYRLLEIAVILLTGSCYSQQIPTWLLCPSTSDSPLLAPVLSGVNDIFLIWLYIEFCVCFALHYKLRLSPYGLFVSLGLPILSLFPKVHNHPSCNKLQTFDSDELSQEISLMERWLIATRDGKRR